jgi:hypothetical protein
MWLVHIFVALFIAGIGQSFLAGSGFVSVHNGAPGFLLFVATLALLRLSERPPRSKESSSVPSEQHESQ